MPITTVQVPKAIAHTGTLESLTQQTVVTAKRTAGKFMVLKIKASAFVLLKQEKTADRFLFKKQVKECYLSNNHATILI